MSEETPAGIYHDMDNDLYHSQKHAVSNSGLGNIIKSPYHYWAKHLNPERPPEPSKAGQLEGTLAHCAILEPDEFNKRYRIGPDVSKATKVWKEADALATLEGFELIKPAQYETAMRQAEQVMLIPEVAEHLSHGMPEVSAFCVDEETGIMCRVRPDWVSELGGNSVTLLDVKTYSDASPAEFARQVARKGYHRQDAMYSDIYGVAAGVEVEDFLFLAVESTYPYAASVCRLDVDSANAGFIEYRDALYKYAECAKADYWPGYGDEITEIRMPNWALAKAENNDEVIL